MPLFIAGVVGLSFLLLLVAFHSPLISLKAAIMNLLSVGAAYGVMTLVAKGGTLGQLIGIDHEVPIAPFMPVMMFAILFGLSMDYEVFLISRIREEYLKDRNVRRAVADGLAKTARVITAAAAIMVVVFLAFLAAPDVFLKLFGIGLASAIFLDATLVRMVLVPAVMQLLGDRNWWIPKWLERILPELDVEPAAPGAEARSHAGACRRELSLAPVRAAPVRQRVEQDLDRRLAIRLLELLAHLADVVGGGGGLLRRRPELLGCLAEQLERQLQAALPSEAETRPDHEAAGQAGCRGARGEGGAACRLGGGGDSAARLLGLRDGRSVRCGGGHGTQPRILPMRSAWSPTRSMSLETLFDVSPNCLLALPTVLATFLTSTLGTLRGTGTPRIVFCRRVPLSTSPPATPTAVAPMAIAGPLTFDAALLTVPTTPPLPAPFWLAVLRLALLDEARFAAGLRLAAGFRAVPLLVEREDDERLLAADFDRDDPLLLGLRLGREAPLDELLLRVPLELALVAILSSPFENVRPVTNRPTQRMSRAIGCRR